MQIPKVLLVNDDAASLFALESLLSPGRGHMFTPVIAQVLQTRVALFADPTSENLAPAARKPRASRRRIRYMPVPGPHQTSHS